MVLLLLACVALHRAGAQADSASRTRGASLAGTVHDSTAHRPLAGAAVQLVASDFVRTARTDTNGAFVLAGIPRGRYTIGFLHPVLDSIGVASPLREIAVDDSGTRMVELAVPSPRRIRSAICGEGAASDSAAVIIGTVRDAITGLPADSVTVRGEWLDFVLDHGAVSRRIAHLEALTGDNGWFALCNVPSSGTVTLRARRGADSTEMLELQVRDGYLRTDIFIAPRAGDAGVPRDGSLSGRVVTRGGNPVANAQVAIVGGPATRTDDRGEFTLSTAPRGSQMLEVRALGFTPHRGNVNVVAGAPRVTVTLATLKAVFDTVKVLAARSPNGPDLGGFADRRRTGQGKYIDPRDMARFPFLNTSDVFQRIPRMKVVDGRLLMRSPFQAVPGRVGGEAWCEVFIFLNGHDVSFMSTDDINDWVPPQNVAGIEVYTEGTVPPQFQVGLGGCGSVVIWTK